MQEALDGDGDVLVVLGCPEVPVQQALALYCGHRFDSSGQRVTFAGNKAVLNLLRVSDPGRVYVKKMVELDRCIEELSTGKRKTPICIVFAHSDAGITYAATVRYLVDGRLVTVIFGRDADALGGQLEVDCEKIIEKAVHNPRQLRKKLDEVFGWAV